MREGGLGILIGQIECSGVGTGQVPAVRSRRHGSWDAGWVPTWL